MTSWDRALWLEGHGDQGMDPEPIDEYADLCRRHAAVAQRIITVAEPMLARPELAEVQESLRMARENLRAWRRLYGEIHVAGWLHKLDERWLMVSRIDVRSRRAERHRLAARLAREGAAR